MLKPKGRLLIAEVKSRFEEEDVGGVEGFVKLVEGMGFDKKKEDLKNKMFAFVGFEKNSRVVSHQEGKKKVGDRPLGACKYKRR